MRGQKSQSNDLETVVSHFSKIAATKCYWGTAEGSAYASLRGHGGRMIDHKRIDPGRIIWTEPARALFKPHPWDFVFGSMKRLLGQYKAPMGNIEILQARQIGNELYVSKARVVPHEGLAKWLALARMWLRRATELFVLLASGVLLAAWLFQCEACWLAVWETRIVFAVGVLAMAAAGAVIVSERRQGWPGVRAAVIGGMVGLAAFVACVLTWHGDIGLFADCFAKSVL